MQFAFSFSELHLPVGYSRVLLPEAKRADEDKRLDARPKQDRQEVEAERAEPNCLL